MDGTTSTGSLDTDGRSYRYYRNAVERHWDPHEIDLDGDVAPLVGIDADAFDNLRGTLALFGAGEESVTEDLAPLSIVLEDIEEQLFVTTQLYEEAKHADFFDRYWRTVINAAERERGLDASSPTQDRWFFDAYEDLFERNERAMARLLEADTPENRAIAFCHYHLTIEGILAQTGYYGLQSGFGGEFGIELPGLVEGLTRIRGDEGRHVGFGMAQLQSLVAEEGVDPELLHETTSELIALTQEIVSEASSGESGHGLDRSELVEYAAENHTNRMQTIVEASDLPDLETLTSLDA